MKAALCLFLLALFKGTFADPLEIVMFYEQNYFDTLPYKIDMQIPDFSAEAEEKYSNLADSALNSRDFDLICHLNTQNGYTSWYNEIINACAAEREAVRANATFWHEKFAATLPELRDLYNQAVATVQGRAGCSETDKTTYADNLKMKIDSSTQTYFTQLDSIMNHGDILVPYEILWGFHYALEAIFMNAQTPNFDSLGAITDAELRHLTMDRLTVIDACKYARWFLEGSTYAQYSSTLAQTRRILEKEVARGASEYICTGV